MRKKQRYSLLVLFSLFVSSICFSQNVKFKKGEIYIDKKLSFTITEKERSNKKDNRNYEMLDSSGEVVFTIKDSIIYYRQLEHELSPRIAYEIHVFDAPKLNRRIELPLITMANFPNRANFYLKKTDLYKTKEFSNEVFDFFAESFLAKDVAPLEKKYRYIDSVRDSINQLAISYHGPLVKRKPSSIYMSANNTRVLESQKLLFTYEVDRKTSIKHRYLMYNANEDLIGWFQLFQNASDQYDNVVIAIFEEKTVLGRVEPSPIEEKKMMFKIPKINYHAPASEDQVQDRIERIVKHLLDIGAL